MKTHLVVLGNLNDFKLVFDRIDRNLFESVTYIPPKKDINNEWLINKKNILLNDIHKISYDWIFISISDINEFNESKKKLIELGVESSKIWYNSDFRAFNFMLMGYKKFNTGNIKYKNDFFIDLEPSVDDLKQKLNFNSMNKLERYFYSNRGKTVYKWLHYFEIYHRHFERFVGKNVTILEIGVFKGGSLELWRHYFGNKCKIYGIDIDPECKNLESDQIEIFIGDVEDKEFLRSVKEKIPIIDILIDDGGHTMTQQIIVFEELYPLISADGVYLCEDLVTSYWEDYGGGYKRENTFIEYSKELIDYLNAWHSWDKDLRVNEFTLSTYSMHYYDAVLVIEKRKMNPPSTAKIGTDSPLDQQHQNGIINKFRIFFKLDW